MICAGATKAGTTSLYRYLHDHADCHLRSVKEIHYFDTVEFDDYDHQLGTLGRLRQDRVAKQDRCRDAGEDWRVRNLDRQIKDVDDLVTLLQLGDDGDAAYLDYLMDGAGDAKLVGDITPGYALLSQARMARIAALSPHVRFVFLMRDPIERLWSHVRMQAVRNCQPGEEVPLKAKRILNRTVKKDMERHIAKRGDYAAILDKLRRAVPSDRLFVGFSEEVLQGDGLKRLCDFLAIGYVPVELMPHVHKGEPLKLNDRQRRDAAEFLAPQYAYAEQHYGPLPDAWQANLARI